MIFTDYNKALITIAQELAGAFYHAPIIVDAKGNLKLTVLFAGREYLVQMGDPDPEWDMEKQAWAYSAAIRLCEPFNTEGEGMWGRTWDVTTPAELVELLREAQRGLSTSGKTPNRETSVRVSCCQGLTGINLLLGLLMTYDSYSPEVLTVAECAGRGHVSPGVDYYGNPVDDHCLKCGICLSDLDAEVEAHWAAIIKKGPSA